MSGHVIEAIGGVLSEFYVSDKPAQENKKDVLDDNGNPVFNIYCVLNWDEHKAKLRFQSSDTKSVEILENAPLDFRLLVQFQTWDSGTTLLVDDYETADTYGALASAKALYESKMMVKKLLEKSKQSSSKEAVKRPASASDKK